MKLPNQVKILGRKFWVEIFWEEFSRPMFLSNVKREPLAIKLAALHACVTLQSA